jgi:hypothetical protein
MLVSTPVCVLAFRTAVSNAPTWKHHKKTQTMFWGYMNQSRSPNNQLTCRQINKNHTESLQTATQLGVAHKG